MSAFILDWVNRKLVACAIALGILFATSSMAHANEENQQVFVDSLEKAQLAEGLEHFEKHLASHPDDEEARACLGVLQFFYAIEGLSQDYYRYGFSPNRLQLPFLLQIPVPENETPEEISYEDARDVVTRFLDRLAAADETLAKCKPCQWKMPLDVLRIYLDVDGDGKSSPKESVASLLATLINVDLGAANRLAQSCTFAFDDADVVWVRGYVNVLSAVTQMILAHDWREAFERTGHLFFAKVQSPYPFLIAEREFELEQFGIARISDIIGFIHLINFECIEPDRMRLALLHIERMIKLSRESWKLIELETDDDREWIPGVRQHSIVLGNQPGGRMGEDWDEVLDQIQAIVEGRELLPFWRGLELDRNQPINKRPVSQPTLGINLRKFFTEPRRFDLVLLIQGTGAQPFLEEGKVVEPEVWQSFSQTFGGRLPFFMFWIN